MLDKYFPSEKTKNKIRSSFIGGDIEAFIIWLVADGYPKSGVIRNVRGAVSFGNWIATRNIDKEEIVNFVFERYEESMKKQGRLYYYGRKRRHFVLGGWKFHQFLKSKIGDTEHTKAYLVDLPPLAGGFRRWMLDHRGVKESTLRGYLRNIAELLNELGDDPKKYSAESLRALIKKVSFRFKKTSTTKRFVSAVRMFLRYLISEGKCNPGLDEAILSHGISNHSLVPKFLPAEDMEKVIVACDTGTLIGIRDPAIILLAARIGLRAGDISNLRFDQIDWSRGIIRLAGKRRQESQIPLPQEVGDAILDYLKSARQEVDSHFVFISALAPFRPISSAAVTNVARRWIERSNIKAPSFGTHLFRHTAATNMLREGASLQFIGKILRHKSVETTANYAKVDFEILKLVVVPWPKVGEKC